jgi:hypothetical protein
MASNSSFILTRALYRCTVGVMIKKTDEVSGQVVEPHSATPKTATSKRKGSRCVRHIRKGTSTPSSGLRRPSAKSPALGYRDPSADAPGAAIGIVHEVAMGDRGDGHHQAGEGRLAAVHQPGFKAEDPHKPGGTPGGIRRKGGNGTIMAGWYPGPYYSTSQCTRQIDARSNFVRRIPT